MNKIINSLFISVQVTLYYEDNYVWGAKMGWTCSLDRGGKEFTQYLGTQKPDKKYTMGIEE
jgi:hypothetical protein